MNIRLDAKYDGKYCTTCDDFCKWVDSCLRRKVLILPYDERLKVMGDILRDKYHPS